MYRNQLQGQGILTFPNNSNYEGNFEDGLYNGEGVFKNQDHQLLYKGEFKHGLPHGKGFLRNGNTNIFDGEFGYGKKISGVSSYEHGMFIGEYDDNQYRKCGKYYFTKPRTVYTGSFFKGLPHGVGQFDWNNQNDSQTLVTVITEMYKGSWKVGMKHGLGILQWNQMTLMTLWIENLKQGPGLLIARNGDIFVSYQMFKDDQYLGSKKVYLNYEKVGLVQNMLNTKHFDKDRFNLLIKDLIKKSREISDLTPFHLPDYQIELHTTPIYNFIANILSTNGLQTSPEQEFKSVNQVIVDQYFTLHEIFLTYSCFKTSNIDGRSVVMNRLGLWQFLRDLGFGSSEISISDLIFAAEKEFQIIVLNSNDFREPVYFCNFLKYLLYITMLLNETEKNQKVAIDAKPPFFGYFATMFLIFLKNVVFKVRPFTKGAIVQKILEHNVNLRKFLVLCSKLTENLTIRTTFQCLSVLKGEESITMIGSLWKSAFKTPEFFKAVSFHDLYQCAVIHFPKITHNQSEENPLITNSTFNITPLEFYELFEAIVILALKKNKHLEVSSQVNM